MKKEKVMYIASDMAGWEARGSIPSVVVKAMARLEEEPLLKITFWRDGFASPIATMTKRGFTEFTSSCEKDERNSMLHTWFHPPKSRKEYLDAWKDAHREEIREYNKWYQASRYLQGKGKEEKQAYYKKNKARIKKRSREYYKEHREEKRERYQRKKEEKECKKTI